MVENKYKLSDFAEAITTSIQDPQSSPYDKFVGLEHYDSGEPVVKRFQSTELLTSACKEFHKNDILIARRNVYLKRAGIAFFDGLTSGDSIVLRVYNDCEARLGIPYDIAVKMLPFVLNSNAFWAYANRHADGMNSKRISKDKVLSYEFTLPSLSEQRRLAEKLWAAYEVKQSYIKMIEATDEMVKSQFIEMFGDISNTHFKYPSKKLGDVCRVINGRAYSAKELLAEGKYRVLRVGNFFSNDTWYYSDLELDSDKYCNTGDLLFAWSCTLGPMIWTEEKVIFHYHIWKIDDYEKTFDREFFYEQLKHIADKMKNETHGSTMVHLTKSQFESVSLIVPPLSEQKRFALFLQQADKSKFELRKSIEAIDKVIKSLINENL